MREMDKRFQEKFSREEEIEAETDFLIS